MAPFVCCLEKQCYEGRNFSAPGQTTQRCFSSDVLAAENLRWEWIMSLPNQPRRKEEAYEHHMRILNLG